MISYLIYFCLVVLVIKLVAHLTKVRCKSNVCLVGKTALVTGGNSGLGLELVKSLAARGCRVIIVDKDDAQKTVESVIKETHNPHISAKMVDLSQLHEVRELANALNNTLDELHILVNNAGMASMTKDGEKAFYVNYFSHFLLTHLLAGLLIKSAPSRVIFTSSLAAYGSPFSDKMDTEDLFHPINVYQYSKLSMAIASRSFAEKFKDFGTLMLLATHKTAASFDRIVMQPYGLSINGVTSNCFHPGLVKTNIWGAVSGFPTGAGTPKMSKVILYYFAKISTLLFGKTSEEGIQTAKYLAIADEVQNNTGQFFMECTPCYQPRKVYDTKFCKKFWEFSEQIVRLKNEEKLEVVTKLIPK